MKKSSVAIAIFIAVIAVPAAADEGRVEARGGAAGLDDNEGGVAGIAGGYDFDLGDSKIFVGVEGSADVTLGDIDIALFGISGRLGAKLGEASRLYAIGGYSINAIDASHVGVGFQQGFGKSLYGKIEYRRFLGRDSDAAFVGVGLRF